MIYSQLFSFYIASAQSFLIIAALASVSFQRHAIGGSSSHSIDRRGYKAIRSMAFQQQLGTFEELTLCDESLVARDDRRVRYFDFTVASPPAVAPTTENGNDSNNEVLWQPGTQVEYDAAWKFQKQLLQSHIDRLTTAAAAASYVDNYYTQSSSTLPSSFLPLDGNDDVKANLVGVDTIVLVEHEPVYTLGTGSDASFILQSQKSGQFVPPIVRIDRGGEVTYHGPGQLTVYPIIDLRNYNQDIHWYVRALEEVVVRAINSVLIDDGQSSLVAHREENITGVWINDYKVAAIGVKCKKWITQHGFAINITPESMQYMDNIVPCGLLGRKVGYVNQFLQQRPITVSQMTQYVIQALGDVFQIQLVPY